MVEINHTQKNFQRHFTFCNGSLATIAFLIKSYIPSINLGYEGVYVNIHKVLKNYFNLIHIQ